MFNSFRDKDMDTCTLWVKESPPGSVSGLFRFRRWLFPALMVAVVFVLILVLGVTNTKTSSRLWTAEEDMSILADRMESLNASLQQSHESIKDLQHLQWSIQDNKDRLASVSAALQQLAVLDSLSRAVDGLKCSLERIVSNSSATGPCCPLDWTRLGSDCYFFSQQHLNWNQSKSWCERKSAHLLILHSNQEWDFVTKKSVPDLYWVGLTDGRTGRWEWVNQTPYTIERRRWVPGQPDAWTGHGMGPEDEDCAHLHSNGRLNDIHCSTTMRFICQRRSTNT
ncbi:C-type lectin domain family 10 member A-like [Xiphophorus maculatus]|uniref:C-type lectin domain family 10 member A-like n=1 Tax=Xiphophorus maculatus TaxID=8083 RepID=A0A3B5R141_XIPMA|nr:C-type lectin domain family 10 member A-like [Xiphophorus maculatus]